MDREITIEYEEKAFVRAYSRYWLSSSGWFYIYSAGVAGLIVFLLVWGGNRELLTIGSFSGVSLALAVVGYWGYSGTIGSVRVMFSDPTLTSLSIRLTEERLCCRDDFFLSEIDWKLIDKLQRYQGIWILFRGRSPFMTLP